VTSRRVPAAADPGGSSPSSPIPRSCDPSSSALVFLPAPRRALPLAPLRSRPWISRIPREPGFHARTYPTYSWGHRRRLPRPLSGLGAKVLGRHSRSPLTCCTPPFNPAVRCPSLPSGSIPRP
jgi:hypothetical protein